MAGLLARGSPPGFAFPGSHPSGISSPGSPPTVAGAAADSGPSPLAAFPLRLVAALHARPQGPSPNGLKPRSAFPVNAATQFDCRPARSFYSRSRRRCPRKGRERECGPGEHSPKAVAAPATVGGEHALDRPLEVRLREGRGMRPIREPGDLPAAGGLTCPRVEGERTDRWPIASPRPRQRQPHPARG